MQISTNIISNSNYAPIFGSTDSLHQSIETLYRLIKLENSLNPYPLMRNKAIKALQTIAQEAQTKITLESIEVVKEIMQSALMQPAPGLKSGKNFLEIYSQEMEMSLNVNRLKKFINRIIKDTASLSTLSVQKSERGQNGPTFIATYVRHSKKCELPQPKEFVIKWTNWNEILTSYIYEAISQNLPHPSFIIPKRTALDFDKMLHVTDNLASLTVEEKLAVHLRQSFHAMVGRNNNPDDTQILLMEKVHGCNLIDFAQNKYPDLVLEEKYKLFQKMGHLAMLDFLIGNTDRLIQTYYDSSTKQIYFTGVEANLDNIMINGCSFYGIDNGINPHLIHCDEEKIAYRQCLENEIDKPDRLAQEILLSVQKSIEAQAENLTAIGKQNLTQTLIIFKPFLDDLKEEFAKKALIEGLQEMKVMLKELLPAFWNGEQAVKLNETLNKNEPELIKAVLNRFEILTPI